MNITSYDSAKIQRSIDKASAQKGGSGEHTHLLFVPEPINDDNVEHACAGRKAVRYK